MKLVQKILLAVDFTEAAEDIVQCAIFAAKKFNSEITLFHAIRPVPDPPGNLRMDSIKKSVKKELQKLREKIVEENVAAAEPAVACGAPFEQIISEANAQNANVIMMAAGHKPDRPASRLGITTERVVRRSLKPVWVVKKGFRSLVERILCAVDFSAHSERAFRNAVHLARTFDAELTALTVVEPLSKHFFSKESSHAQTQESYHKSQSAQFEKFLGKFDLHKIKIQKLIKTGKPAEEIVKAAQQANCDLLTLGSAGRTGLARVFIGSTAEKVLMQLPCSAIMFKSEDAVKLEFQADVEELCALFKQAKELLDKGFAKEAAVQLEKYLQRDPNCAPAWDCLARAYSHLGHESESKKCAEHVKHLQDQYWKQLVEYDLRKQYIQKSRKL